MINFAADDMFSWKDLIMFWSWISTNKGQTNDGFPKTPIRCIDRTIKREKGEETVQRLVYRYKNYLMLV